MAEQDQSGSMAEDKAPLPSVDDLKTQVTQAAEGARASLNAFAAEARGKITDVVDQQKAAGAEHLTGFARAAQTAAGDLEQKSPAAAKLVRDAASSVEHIATDLRDSDIRDLVASVSSFARQQPVAFLAGSVLIGFALARFLKSEMPPGSPGGRSYRPAAGGYRDWSSSHPEPGQFGT